MKGEECYLERLALAIKATDPDSPIELCRIYAVLALAKAPDVTNEDVHNAWCAWCLSVYAEHSSLVPYRDLPHAVKMLDTMYRDTINGLRLVVA